MRIVHVYKDSFPPVHGGIEQHIALLASGQIERGHDVELVVAGARPGRRETADVGGVRITRLPELGRFASSPLTSGFITSASRWDADVVHFHHPNPVGELALSRVNASTRTVVTYHADITRQRYLGAAYGTLLNRFLDRVDVVIVASSALSDNSPRLAGRPVRVVPYGVPASTSVGVPVTRPPGRLLFVGRLREYKGVPVLLRALSRYPRLTLDVVGHGPMEGQLQRLASHLGISDRVRFLGDLSADELDLAYRQARALVLPSIRRSEAFGLVLAEALMRGTPCISTELGTATSWVNLDDVTGLVVRPDDPEAMGEACQRMVEDERSWRRWSAGARDRSALFSADRMIDSVLDAYSAH